MPGRFPACTGVPACTGRLGFPLGARLGVAPSAVKRMMVVPAHQAQVRSPIRFRAPAGVFAAGTIHGMDRVQRVLAPVILSAIVMSGCAGADDAPGSTAGPMSDLTLRIDGIGSYAVGMPAAQVIEGISAEIGGWDADSADRDDTIPLPDCGLPQVRIVTWGTLVAVFDGTGSEDPFFTWSYGFDPVTGNAGDPRELRLVTDRGVGLGTPRPDVERIYRGRIDVVDDDTIDVTTFTIDGDEAEHLAGRFPSTDPDELLQYLERVPACTFGSGSG